MGADASLSQIFIVCSVRSSVSLTEAFDKRIAGAETQSLGNSASERRSCACDGC